MPKSIDMFHQEMRDQAKEIGIILLIDICGGGGFFNVRKGRSGDGLAHR